MRGHAFHNHVIERAAQLFRQGGFTVDLECPMKLPDGRTAFVDLLASRGGVTIACEVETTPRHALFNACKVLSLGVTLWIIAPTRQVRASIVNKCRQLIGENRFCILLL